MGNLFAVYQSTAVLATGDPIELSPATEYWQDVFNIDLHNILLPGDVLLATASHEFTNDVGSNVGIVTTLTLHNNVPWGDEPLVGKHSSPSAGMYFVPPSGDDVNTSTNHHCYRSLTGVAVIPQNNPYAGFGTVRLRVAAQSNLAMSMLMPLTIMPSGYGQLSVMLFR